MKFKNGDDVCRVVSHHHDYLRHGVIRGTSEDGHPEGQYLVEWEAHFGGKPEFTRVAGEGLMLASEAKAKKDALEEAYQDLSDQLQEKMNQAAELIHEANRLANAHGEQLSTVYEASRQLLQAMDEAGWMTSSLSC